MFDVIVRVKARGDLKDVRLSKGLMVSGAPFIGTHRQHLMSCGNSAVVTYSPPESSGFPLADGETRSFVFRVRAHRWGPSTLEVDAIGLNDTGKTEQTAATVVNVSHDPLTRGGREFAPGGITTCTAAQHG